MFEANDKNHREKEMTRRKFVISLGVGVTSVIAGYFLVSDAFSPPQPTAGKHDDTTRPQLHQDVIFGKQEGLITLYRPQSEEPVLCAVNPLGAEIVKKLDGKHTIADIGNSLAAKLGNCSKEEREAKIACFVAHTSMYGFLTQPFYACLFETYDV